MMFHATNVFFDASIVLESRAAALQHDRAIIELLAAVALPSLIPSCPDLDPPTSPPKRRSLSGVPSSIVSASLPCILPSLFSSGVNGGMAANAILAQKITNNPRADANAISGKVWLSRNKI